MLTHDPCVLSLVPQSLILTPSSLLPPLPRREELPLGAHGALDTGLGTAAAGLAECIIEAVQQASPDLLCRRSLQPGTFVHATLAQARVLQVCVCGGGRPPAHLLACLPAYLPARPTLTSVHDPQLCPPLFALQESWRLCTDLVKRVSRGWEPVRMSLYRDLCACLMAAADMAANMQEEHTQGRAWGIGFRVRHAG